MASTDSVASSQQYILIGDVEANRPNSEAVQSKIGGSINYLLDQSGRNLVFKGNGFYIPNPLTNAVDGVVRLDRDYQINNYFCSWDNIGTANTTVFNIGVYDEDDVFINNIFGSGANRFLLSGDVSNRSGVVIGRDVLNAQTIEENASGLTYQLGVVNAVSLLKGYKLRFFIEANADFAKSFRFELNLGGL